jgi:hypothetical protein
VRHNKLFIFSKGCCLTYSMIRILKRPLSDSIERWGVAAGNQR